MSKGPGLGRSERDQRLLCRVNVFDRLNKEQSNFRSRGLQHFKWTIRTEMFFISTNHAKGNPKSSSLTSNSDRKKGNKGRPKPMGQARREALGGVYMWEGLQMVQEGPGALILLQQAF